MPNLAGEGRCGASAEIDPATTVHRGRTRGPIVRLGSMLRAAVRGLRDPDPDFDFDPDQD